MAGFFNKKNMMTKKIDKNQITSKLLDYVGGFDSPSLASKTLKGVSSVTVSEILAGKWDKISDPMWRNIAGQVGVSDWNGVQTSCSKLIVETFTDAQNYANIYALTAKAGSGKTFAAKHYVRSHPNAYHIICCQWWTIKVFFGEILRVMGLASEISYNDNAATMAAISHAMREKSNPLLIIDELDKLSDCVLYGQISLCNELEEICGMVLMATDNLSSRITAGVRTNRRGYNELYSRIGRRFIAVAPNRQGDIAKICIANGVSDPEQIDKITSDCDFDLRRVKRFIHSYKLLQCQGR